MINRREFLFGLASVICLGLPKSARASAGLFEPFSFAYVTDAHLISGVHDSYIMLQESQLFLQDVVKQLNEQKLDFVLFGGDQVERPGENDNNWQLFLDVVQSLSAPWTFVLGEQDVSGPRVVDKMHTYGLDWKGKGIETSTPYWSQSPLSGVHLIGLDTSRPNIPTGQLSAEQLDWLKNDLAKNTRLFTIVCSHHPLLPPPPFDGGPPWDDYIVPNGANAREILGSSKYVRLVLNGHVHMSKVQQERDIWYVSNPSLAVYPCAFRIFHVTPDDITVETYQVQFPALIKRGFQLLASSPLAFKYSEKKPESFCWLAEGSRLDQSAELSLAPGGTAQAVRPEKHSKKKAKPEKPAEEPHKKRKKHQEEEKSKAKESKPQGQPSSKEKAPASPTETQSKQQDVPPEKDLAPRAPQEQ
ncbi:MAG TPA: metallophosphoesterase [Planktothrix sp.]|jgi:Icc protein